MTPVYHAAHSLEAHMILDLLRQEGIHGRVEGEYLQGAIGALPASGLVRVVVDEADQSAAERLIARWNQQQPATDPPAAPRASQQQRISPWLFLAAGVVLGVGFCQASLHPTPAPDASALACTPA